MGAQKNRLKRDGSFEYPQHLFSLRKLKIEIRKILMSPAEKEIIATNLIEFDFKLVLPVGKF